MKRIGLRTLKTAICVFICAMIYVILRFIDDKSKTDFHFSYVLYSPFFAGIATAYSLYPDKKRSLIQAKNRIIASLIGGLIGILLVVIYELITKSSWPHIFDASKEFYEFIIPFILVGIITIIVIHTAVLLNQKNAAFVAVLTFISITLNPNDLISSEYGEWLFGFNRILSTIIGVLVALIVNLFKIPHRIKNKDLLFCVGIEDILKSDNATMKGFMNYKLNHMSYIGANCTLFTTRTPATFMPILKDVDIKLPVICFSGAALYDPNRLEFSYKVIIDDESRIALEKCFNEVGVSPFKNYIIDNVHHIFNNNIHNLGEELYKATRKNDAYVSYDEIDSSSLGDLIYYLIIDEIASINKLKEAIENGPLNDKVVVKIYDYFDSNDDIVPELKYAKIYNKDIENLDGLKDFAKNHNFRIVGLTATPISNNLLKNSDYKVTYSSNKEALPYTDIVIETKTYDDLFKTMNKMYYSKKYYKKAE